MGSSESYSVLNWKLRRKKSPTKNTFTRWTVLLWECVFVCMCQPHNWLIGRSSFPIRFDGDSISIEFHCIFVISLDSLSYALRMADAAYVMYGYAFSREAVKNNFMLDSNLRWYLPKERGRIQLFNDLKFICGVFLLWMSLVFLWWSDIRTHIQVFPPSIRHTQR